VITVTDIRRAASDDGDRIVELSLHAWAPVFASFRAVLGDDLYDRVHPDWQTDQAASVRQALEQHETWVAVKDARITGFVNVIFNRRALRRDLHDRGRSGDPTEGDRHAAHRACAR
jgi:hypothetical protein